MKISYIAAIRIYAKAIGCTMVYAQWTLNPVQIDNEIDPERLGELINAHYSMRSIKTVTT